MAPTQAKRTINELRIARLCWGPFDLLFIA